MQEVQASSRVAPGISRLPVLTPTLPPATHTNSYLLGSREFLLVEPASPYESEQRALVEWVHGEQTRGRTLIGVLATHHHQDHIGAIELAEVFDVPRWLHPQTYEHVQAGAFATDRPPRELADGGTFTLDGPEPETWSILHTPGHASGHVCLLRPSDRVLVVGDMVASEGTILIAKGDGHMATYLKQLERLLALDAELALPAHGDPIAAPGALFQHYLNHRRGRERRILECTAAFGPEGAELEAILKSAYADVAAALLPVARLSLEAHLEKLSEEGLVRVAGERFAA